MNCKSLCPKNFTKKERNGGRKMEEIICHDPVIALAMLNCLSSGQSTSRHKPQDFFQQTKLINEVNKNEFTANLHGSTWSDNFVHGADMMPGMTEGFINYCQKHNTQFKNIQQIKFKKKTQGDIHYIILTTPSQTLKEDSNIIGSFLDIDNNKYYFYGEERKRKKRPITYDNNLSLELLNVQENEFSDDKTNGIKLASCSNQSKDDYLNILENNKGFIRSTIVDMINLIYQQRLQSSGLVMGYEDLKLEDGFNIKEFLNGSYRLYTDLLGSPRQTDSGIGYKISFDLKNKEESIVASGQTMLWTPETK